MNNLYTSICKPFEGILAIPEFAPLLIAIGVATIVIAWTYLKPSKG